MVKIKSGHTPKEVNQMPNDLLPGDHHYRAYVGDPRHYDLVSAVTFQILTLLGLRETHSVLDIGCGSLRNARLLIPYLNAGNYFGVEPDQWLVDEGIRLETGSSQIKVKRPTFSFRSDLNDFPKEQTFDYILLQSIFSHSGPDVLSTWLDQLAPRMHTDSLMVGTYYKQSQDGLQTGWVYPGLVPYRQETFAGYFESRNVIFNEIEWPHPRQQWFVASRSKVDVKKLSIAGKLIAESVNGRWHRRKKN